MMKVHARVVGDLTSGGSARWWAVARPLLAAVLLGVGVLYVVGFAGAHAIHEAAHDARHTLNFPCH
jgi:cobalt transporter subunit CbtB